MGLLQRAPEVVELFPLVYTADGYGEGETPIPDMDAIPTTFTSFIIPVGYSGAGWAADVRFQNQGWADVARDRIIFDPDQAGAAGIVRWSRLRFRGELWTVQEDPRLLRGARKSQRLMTATVEKFEGD